MFKTPKYKLPRAMAPMNLLPSMLSTYLCLSFILYFGFNPTKVFSNAENIGDGNNSTIKGMFVFGSSFLDNGNNNFLETLDYKADYLPYGMDFQLGPSGRFTNGKIFIDALGDLLNIPAYIPAFHDPSTKGNHTAVGVNYASGGSGILDDTGSIEGEVMSFNKQIKEFEEVTLPELQNQQENSSRESLSKYLFVIGSGENDYTYFLNKSQSNVSVREFTTNLTTIFSSQLKKLYNLGAQKFVIISMYPLGCSPGSIAAQPKRKGCNKSLNEAALFFNANLKTLIKGIRPQQPGPNFVMVNAYNIIRDMIRNPALYGFSDATKPCCQVTSKEEGGNGISCKKGGTTCENRNKNVYFDALHPTEAVNVVLATKAFSSNLTSDVYPFSIRKLAQM